MAFRIVFAGTPEFAVPSLQSLIDSHHHVSAVFTKQDVPQGRGRKIIVNPVKRLAEQYQIPVYQPATLKNQESQRLLSSFSPDVMVVVAYGLVLPKALFEIPKRGCINVHASLLPRWRGAAPIQRAILAGDEITGVSIMQIAEGVDTGPVFLRETCAIYPRDTAKEVHDRLAHLGANTLLTALEGLEKGTLTAHSQDKNQVTYANKIAKEEAELNWQLSAEELDRKIRAFNPWPVAYTHLNNERIRIWDSEPTQQHSALPPGTVIFADHKGITVSTGKDVLRLLKIQLAGGRPMQIKDFLNSRAGLIVPEQTRFL